MWLPRVRLTVRRQISNHSEMILQVVRRIGVSVLLVAFSLCAFAQQPAAAMRVWTAANGQKFQAKFVGVEGENVTLLLATGQTSKFALNLLSAADQAAARGGAAAIPAVPTTPAAAPAANVGKPAAPPIVPPRKRAHGRRPSRFRRIPSRSRSENRTPRSAASFTSRSRLNSSRRTSSRAA